ncbi:MAG: hypothetical protein ONB30_11975 [candidate division KSB1 bacterium]|nr:hypothetical protein [candidate division KSB1 bacterium]
MRRQALVSLCLMVVAALAWAADLKQQQAKGLAKPMHTRDIAVGILDVGKVQHAVFNDGRLSTWDYRPQVPAFFYKGWSYVPDLFPMLGIPDGPWAPRRYDPVKGDTVSMGPTVSETNVADDWGPKAGSYGKLHSGDVTVGDVMAKAPSSIKGLPIVATSTIEASWPKDASGNRFWPGPWARDPKTGETIVGKFTSDKDVFFVMNDYDLNNVGQRYAESDGRLDQGYATGIDVEVTAYAYGRSYAEDFIFFPCRIINNSKKIDPRGKGYDYKGVYFGFYIDADLPEYNLTTTINDRMDWMGFLLSEYDAKKDTTYRYNTAYFYDYRWGTGDFSGVSDPAAWKVYIGLKLLETPKAPPGGVDLDKDGIIDIPEGQQLGLTDWHWFNWEQRPGVLTPDKQELEQYKVMSGDTSNLSVEQQDNYFWPDPTGKLNPHLDSPELIREKFPTGLDCVFIMSTGPFDLAVGDTTTFSFCMIAGDDFEDYKFNCRNAQFMYELFYQGADPPSPPRVTAVPGDGKVTLYWDSSAEESRDLMTGAKDFQGYRIYRTTSNPANNEWGEIIRDGLGNAVGFVPVAQFDINDNVSGLDPNYPHLNLGNNSGLVHSWTDNNVKNGVTYWYSVTAYDRGISLARGDSLALAGWADLNSLECAKGVNPQAAPNLVEVTPGKTPSNYVAPTIAVEALPGAYSGNTVTATIFDQFAITGHSYLVTIDDSKPGVKYYDVVDEVTGQQVVDNGPLGSTVENPIFDGLQMRVVERFSSIRLDPDSVYWYRGQRSNKSPCNWQVTGSPAGDFPYDYEFRFVSEPDTAFQPATYITPFEIWNLTLGKKAAFGHFTPNPADTTAQMKATWTSGDELKLREVPEVGKPAKFTWTFKLSAPPPRIDSTLVGGKWVYTKVDTGVAPQTGDVLRIISGKPFLGKRDKFRLNTSRYALREAEKADLKKVRVVPNPYIISAQWELDPNQRLIQFTNLPNKCDIHIYTITGERVYTLHHDHETRSWEYWNMLSFNQQEVAYGMYIYVVETPNGNKEVGKFAVIR